MEASKGQVLGERFRLVGSIGGDAAFSRWLAQDLVLDGETVEIAFMPPEVAASGRAQAGVKDAVAATMSLLHTNIATARAYVDDAEAPFFVFDHVEGQTLDLCLDEWGKLGEDEVKALLEPLASALDFAHSQGLPHGDLRPSNIVISDETVPWLIGFGVVAGMRDAVARMRGETASGPVCWMSPEQLLGEPPTPAQDIYSLSAIAYECLSGHPPFHRGRVEFQILNADPKPLEPETPFTRAVLRALSKNPAARPKTCAELLAGDFEKVEMPEVVAAIPVKAPAVRRPRTSASVPPAFPQRPIPAPPPEQLRGGVYESGPPVRIELPGMPPHQRGAQPPQPPQPPRRRAPPTPEEIERRRQRLARVEERRKRHHEAEKRRNIADAAYFVHQDAASTRKATWALAAVAVAATAVVAAVIIGGHGNAELANAPTRNYSVRDLGRYTSFHGIEFGRVIPETPEPGDLIVFGDATNRVGNVSMDGRLFEVELAEPVYTVFPVVRISLTETEGGRRISALTFERGGESVTAEKARKAVANIAARVGKEYGIDMGDTLTAINNAYFSQRYSDDQIDIRISSVVAPDSTSISLSMESRVIRAMEVVSRR